MKQSTRYVILTMATLFSLNAAAFAGSDDYILKPSPIKKAPHIAVYDLKKPLTSGGTYLERQGTHVAITCGTSPTVSLTRRTPQGMARISDRLSLMALRFEATRDKTGHDKTKAVLFFIREPNTVLQNETIDKHVPNGIEIDKFCGANGLPLIPTRDQIMDWQINLDKALMQYRLKL